MSSSLPDARVVNLALPPKAPGLQRLAPPMELSALSRPKPTGGVAAAARVRPINRNAKWSSLPVSLDSDESDAAVLGPMSCTYYTIHSNGHLQKRTTQRPSSSCFGYRFRSPLYGEVVFHSYHTPSTGMSSSDKSMAASSSLCKYLEMKVADFANVKKALEIGPASTITGVLLSYILPPDSKLYIADLPGSQAMFASNTRLNCRTGSKTEVTEFPWDEEDFMEGKYADLIVGNTCSFMEEETNGLTGIADLQNYLRNLVGPNTRAILSYHKHFAGFLEKFQTTLDPSLTIEEESMIDAVGFSREVIIISIRRITSNCSNR